LAGAVIRSSLYYAFTSIASNTSPLSFPFSLVFSLSLSLSLSGYHHHHHHHPLSPSLSATATATAKREGVTHHDLGEKVSR